MSRTRGPASRDQAVPPGGADPERLARLEREARTVAALNHPNIVSLFAIEQAQGAPFLVMERVSGRSLAEIVEPGASSVARIMEKDGYETVLTVASTRTTDANTPDIVIPYALKRVLDRQGSVPAGMVRVQGGDTVVGRMDDSYIDRHEAKNRQCKDFIAGGGYKKREHWKQRFVRDGEPVLGMGRAWNDWKTWPRQITNSVP